VFLDQINNNNSGYNINEHTYKLFVASIDIYPQGRKYLYRYFINLEGDY